MLGHKLLYLMQLFPQFNLNMQLQIGRMNYRSFIIIIF